MYNYFVIKIVLYYILLLGEIKINKLISIVVPVYNKEPFIERCVQSLVDLEMDHTQIEAIFVDDLSSDRSYEILQYYEKKYDFIKCVQLEEIQAVHLNLVMWVSRLQMESILHYWMPTTG